MWRKRGSHVHSMLFCSIRGWKALRNKSGWHAVLWFQESDQDTCDMVRDQDRGEATRQSKTTQNEHAHICIRAHLAQLIDTVLCTQEVLMFTFTPFAFLITNIMHGTSLSVATMSFWINSHTSAETLLLVTLLTSPPPQMNRLRKDLELIHFPLKNRHAWTFSVVAVSSLASHVQLLANRFRSMPANHEASFTAMTYRSTDLLFRWLCRTFCATMAAENPCNTLAASAVEALILHPASHNDNVQISKIVRESTPQVAACPTARIDWKHHFKEGGDDDERIFFEKSKRFEDKALENGIHARMHGWIHTGPWFWRPAHRRLSGHGWALNSHFACHPLFDPAIRVRFWPFGNLTGLCLLQLKPRHHLLLGSSGVGESCLRHLEAQAVHHCRQGNDKMSWTGLLQMILVRVLTTGSSYTPLQHNLAEIGPKCCLELGREHQKNSSYL